MASTAAAFKLRCEKLKKLDKKEARSSKRYRKDFLEIVKEKVRISGILVGIKGSEKDVGIGALASLATAERYLVP